MRVLTSIYPIPVVKIIGRCTLYRLLLTKVSLMQYIMTKLIIF